MVKKGYSPPFCGAVQAAAGPLGALIPPSVGLIIYGVTANLSISDLFLATVLPGLLMGLALMIVSGYLAHRKGFGREREPTTLSTRQAFKEAVWALFMPVIILGGIYGGICTPTEAAVLAVVYGLFVGACVHHELKPSMLLPILVDSVVGTALIMIIIDFSIVFSTFLIGNRIPQMVAETLLGVTDNRVVILIIINVLLLFVGTFMDLAPAVVILVPILVPLANRMGYDPIHFGIIVTTNLLIGSVTPPVGLCLFMGSRISHSKIDAVIRELWPLIGTMIAVLAAVSLFPGLSLALLRIIGTH